MKKDPGVRRKILVYKDRIWLFWSITDNEQLHVDFLSNKIVGFDENITDGRCQDITDGRCQDITDGRCQDKVHSVH